MKWLVDARRFCLIRKNGRCGFNHAAAVVSLSGAMTPDNLVFVISLRIGWVSFRRK
jgi:hypothetical protein